MAPGVKPSRSRAARAADASVALGVFGLTVLLGAYLTGFRGREPTDATAEAVASNDAPAPPPPPDAPPDASATDAPAASSTVAAPEPPTASASVTASPTSSGDAPGYPVDRTPTPLSEREIALVLSEAHVLEFGERPTPLRLGIAWAHIALEHQRGTAIECNNFGNLSVWEASPGPHYVRILKERRRAGYGQKFGRWRWVEMRFRAFETPLAGARAYWRHLQDHYAKALVLFSVGNGYDAGLKLAQDGYATAYSGPYARSIANLAGEFKLEILPELPPDATGLAVVSH